MSPKPTYEELERRIEALESAEIAHRQTVSALRENERRLQSIIHALPDLVWLKDKEGVYLACNARFERFFGVKEQNIVGKSDYDFMEKERADFFRAYDLAAVEKGGPSLNEEEITFADDGHREILETIKTPIYSENGDLVGVLGIGRDITERKWTAAALHESEEKYRLLFNTFPLGITITDAAGNILETNDKASELLGISKEEHHSRMLEGADWRIVRPDGADMPPDEWAGVRALRENRLVENPEVGVERPGGEIVWLHVKAVPLPLEKYGVVITYSDITDRKSAEAGQQKTQAELINRNRFIETILEYLPIGLGVNEIDSGNVSYLNRKFEEIYGWPKEDFSNVALFFDKVYPDPVERESLKARIMADISSGDESRMAWEGLEVTTKSGEKRIVYAKNIPLMDQNLMISTVQDYTEKRRLEDQVQQSQKMESIGRLAGGIAHDFNNMLSLIIGHAELALEAAAGGPQLRESLSEIQKAGERSADLTRQLLAFARKQTVSPKILDLNATIDGMIKMLRRLIGEDVELRWLPGASVRPVKMDPSQLDQILANLCVNARDAISDIGTITIETADAVFDASFCVDHPEYSIGEYVRLTVSDNGCGMDGEVLANLFEPFFTTKEAGKGTGLGLATVYGAVKQNNGFVIVHSRPGEGARFEIYLPRHPDGTDEMSATRDSRPIERGSGTILLVEDDLSILKMTTMMLERMGYRVLPSATPGEALRIAEAHPNEIDLLVTDVVMPKMNGRDLSAAVSAVCPGLRRLYMSGYTADVIAHHGVLEDGVNYIQKPFTKQQLGAKVKETLGRQLEAGRR